MKSYLSYLFLLSFIALIGCKSSCDKNNRSGQGAGAVRIVTAEPDPRVCQYVGDTMGYSTIKNLSTAQDRARSMIKRKAYGMGGNIVRLDTTTDRNKELVLNGRVFLCDMDIDPEEILGPIGNDSEADGNSSLGSSEKSNQANSSNPASTNNSASGTSSASGSNTQSESITPPPPPNQPFNEQAFLNSGENEFEG